MILNSLKVAIRTIIKNKVYALINIVGLSIGIAAALLIYLYVHHEFSYEQFWPDNDRIYRVVTNMHFPDSDFKNSGVPGPLPEAVRNEMPEIEHSTLFWDHYEMEVKVNRVDGSTQTFKDQEHCIFADEHYFEVFPYTWLAGSAENTLQNPYEAVLTESRAALYFPDQEPEKVLGKTLTYDDTVNVTITGVVKDLDQITNFNFLEFISLPTFSRDLRENHSWEDWGSVNSSTQFFVKLQEDSEVEEFNKALADVREKYATDEAYLETDHFLQPLLDIHFNSDFNNYSQRFGHRPTLVGLIFVALIIILLGAINFVNLTTARAFLRAKEVGIRKTVGGSRKNIIFDFLIETLLLSTVAALVALVLLPLLLKSFSDYLPEALSFQWLYRLDVLLFLIGLTVLIALLSGLYPAYVLAKFKPALALSSQIPVFGKKSGKMQLRQVLTVSQFAIAQFFIVLTFISTQQIRYSLNKDMGFKQDAIVYFRTPFDSRQASNQKKRVLKEELQAIPGIRQLSLAGNPPASGSTNISTMTIVKDGEEIETTVEIKQADTSYIQLYEIPLLAGRNLQQTDSIREYLVNEAYTKFLGYDNPAEIIGNTFNAGSGAGYPIVGVVADFNTKSTRAAVKPLAFRSQMARHSVFHVALENAEKNTNDWSTTIKAIENAWEKVYPEDAFSYQFFDESIAKFYKKDQQLAKLLVWSTGITIFISCLGLLGLTIFTIGQRTKEIGIRKVLGAKVSTIVLLLSKDILKLILIALIIATPFAWYASSKWLESYVYRIDIQWFVFFITGFLAVLVAFITISFQSIKAALANPVDALRSE